MRQINQSIPIHLSTPYWKSTRRTQPADRLPSSPWQHDRDHPRRRPGLLGSHAKMLCGFQPAGFPRHRVATSAHSLVCLAQKPFLLFPSVSFCYGLEFLSTALAAVRYHLAVVRSRPVLGYKIFRGRQIESKDQGQVGELHRWQAAVRVEMGASAVEINHPGPGSMV